MAKENFFDFRERLLAKPQAATDKAGAGGPEPLTVSQLTSQIERAIKSGLPSTVHVKGEVSNCNLHRASGHLYFTLKDASACIDCVMFRSDAARLKFAPGDGMELLASGRVAIYAQRGRYQLYVTSLSALGRGALELAFQQLCEKLKKEGLFDAARKKPLPPYPMHIAMVTSRSTAALQDMLKVLRRFPWLRLSVYHVPVQGEGAAPQIAQALEHLNAHAGSLGGIDVILLGRGGGSLEDLWAFNEEVVARAVAASRIPIVTGIGHEVDVSIADLVADVHAHTPTEAAQVVTSNWRIARDLIETSGIRLGRGIAHLIQDVRQRLSAVQRHEFFRRPTDRINQLRQFLDDRQRSLLLALSDRLHQSTTHVAKLEAMLIERHPRHLVALKGQKLTDLSRRLTLVTQHDLAQRRRRLDSLQRNLDAVSPQAVLHRGYSITTRKKTGQILRSSKAAKLGERLLTRFADGQVESTVQDQQQLPLFE